MTVPVPPPPPAEPARADAADARPPLRPDRRRLLTWAAAAAAGCACVAVASVWPRSAPPPPHAAPGLSTTRNSVTLSQDAPQWAVLKLGVAARAAPDFTDPVPARVVIDETRSSRVGVPLAGRVTQVFVELGQRVREGDRLFAVASQGIADLRAERERAAVDLSAARAQLERVRAMVASRALPAKEEMAAEREARDAEVESRLADAKLRSLRVSDTSENEFSVLAPRTGVVVDKDVLPGQAVSPDGSGAVMTIADLASVWVVADLFEADAGQVRPGAEARITSPSIPDHELVGRVEMVSSVVDPARHTVPIRVVIPNPRGLLRPNVFARVRFAASHDPDSVEVPASALVSDGEHQYVYVETHPGRFARRAVVAGPVHEGRAPVLQGLSTGDTVVVQGAILLDNQIALDAAGA